MSDLDLQDSYTESNRIDKIDTEAERAAKHNEPINDEIGVTLSLITHHENMIIRFENKIETLKKKLI